MIDTLHFEFGEIRVFRNFVIAFMKEGTTVVPEHNRDLEKIAKKYYKDKKFGYITYRMNSYAVDPLVYVETSKIPNLVAFAVVAKDILKESNFELEKLFLSKPCRCFLTLDQAKDWVNEMVEKTN